MCIKKKWVIGKQMKVVKNCENDGVVMRSKMMAFFQKKQQQKLEENVERKVEGVGGG